MENRKFFYGVGRRNNAGGETENAQANAQIGASHQVDKVDSDANRTSDAGRQADRSENRTMNARRQADRGENGVNRVSDVGRQTENGVNCPNGVPQNNVERQSNNNNNRQFNNRAGRQNDRQNPRFDGQNRPNVGRSEAAQPNNFDRAKLEIAVSSLQMSDGAKELLTKFNINTAADLVKRTERDMYKVQGLNKKVLFEVKGALEKEGMCLRPEQPRTQNTASPNSQRTTQDGANAQNANGNDRNSANAQRPLQDGVSPQNSGFSDRNNANRGNDRSSFNRNNSNGNDRNNANRGNDRNSFNRDNDRNNANRDSDRNGFNRGNERGGRNLNKVAPIIEKPIKLTAPLPVAEWRKIQKGGKWGFYDGFKTVIPAMYDEIFCFKDELASVELDEKCGYIDCANNLVIPFDYDSAMSFSEGYACVVKGLKCGYINKLNEVIIPFEYEAGTPFENGEAKVKKDGKWGTIIPDGSIKWI